jgi:2-keto-4-pentenoate hydratase
MGYKILGFVVWRGAHWYLGRRYPHLGRNLVIGAVVSAGATAGAVAVAQRQRSS